MSHKIPDPRLQNSWKSGDPELPCTERWRPLSLRHVVPILLYSTPSLWSYSLLTPFIYITWLASVGIQVYDSWHRESGLEETSETIQYGSWHALSSQFVPRTFCASFHLNFTTGILNTLLQEDKIRVNTFLSAAKINPSWTIFYLQI